MDGETHLRVVDNMDLAATCAIQLYKALLKQGFFDEQALQLVTAAMHGYLRGR